MSYFQVSTGGLPPVTVEAANWLSALGEGLEQLGSVASIDRLACEVLPNGKVIARDVRTGMGFVVQAASEPAPEPVAVEETAEAEITEPDTLSPDCVEPLDPDSESTTGAFVLSDNYDKRQLADPVVLNLLEEIRQAPSDLIAWQVALDVAHELIPCEAGAGMVRLDSGELLFAAASGPHGHKLAAVKLPAGTGIVGFCVQRSVSLMVKEPVHDDRFYDKVDDATGYKTRTILAVPVGKDDGTFGCLEMLNPPPEAPFSRLHLELLLLVASTLGQRLEGPP